MAHILPNRHTAAIYYSPRVASSLIKLAVIASQCITPSDQRDSILLPGVLALELPLVKDTFWLAESSLFWSVITCTHSRQGQGQRQSRSSAFWRSDSIQLFDETSNRPSIVIYDEALNLKKS
jgi:hypothetical protein